LLLAPHHDVGFTEDLKQRQQEYLHHGDALVPRQQRFGQYTRSMIKGLGVPVINQFGLRPALVKGTKQIAPLTINRDLDVLELLNGVSTFNFHPHLPHYALTTEDTKSVHVLTRQPIDLERPHPFIEAGNTEFNSCIWMPPNTHRVNALGFGSTLMLPARKMSVGVKYFKEFEDRSTFQGYSMQITASIKF